MRQMSRQLLSTLEAQSEVLRQRERAKTNGIGRKPVSQSPAPIEPSGVVRQKAVPAPRPEPTRNQRIMRRHRMLMKSKEKHARDVRFFLWVATNVEYVMVRAIHLRIDAGQFVSAHARGFCSSKMREIRRGKCKPCDWSYEDKARSYCKGCNCGNTIVSRITHKTRLAGFKCPKKLFGRAKGWFGRFFGWMFSIEETIDEAAQEPEAAAS